MEDFAERGGFRRVGGVGGHDIAHMLPPLLAYGGLGDGLPLRFVLDLDIGEELAGLGMKEDGVVMCSVLLEDRFQLWPYWAMAMLILLFLSGVHRHHECFADHFHEFLSMSIRG